MTLGNRIAHYRKKLGLTQEALAQEFGVTNQAVSKWESDQTCPDIQLLPQLADFFGISMDELFGRERVQQTLAADLDGLSWPDDGILRVVVYEGRKLICGGKAARDFSLKCNKNVQEVLSCVSVTCGDVQGNVFSNLNVRCGDVGGKADAGTSINCAAVGGNADAGTSIFCGDVSGHVDAGSSVTCGNVLGNVDAGSDVTCGNVEGSVDAGGNVRCGSVAGDVDAGGKVHIG